MEIDGSFLMILLRNGSNRQALETMRRRFLQILNGTLNQVTRRIARSGHGPFSLIRHVGRRSGRMYETPLILVRVPEGFVAELTYGENVNWYRNVVAAGHCVVIHHSREYPITGIERLDAGAGRRAFPRPFRQILTVTRRSEFRLLRTGPA